MPVISVSECLTDMLKCLVCGVEGFLKVGFKAALYWKRKQKRYRWWADIVMFVGERRVMVMADGNFSGGCDNAHAIGQLEGRKMLERKELTGTLYVALIWRRHCGCISYILYR